MISFLRLRGLFLGLSCVGLAGCNTVVMHPSGDIASQQAQLIVVSTLLLLLIIVPVIVLTLLFAWRYRQSNTAATYSPDWDHSTSLELLIWGAPLLIIIKLEQYDYRGATAIAVVMLTASFGLLLLINLIQKWSRRHHRV